MQVYLNRGVQDGLHISCTCALKLAAEETACRVCWPQWLQPAGPGSCARIVVHLLHHRRGSAGSCEDPVYCVL